MPDQGDVIDDPESGPLSSVQGRIREEGGWGDKPLPLDAEAILRKLDKRSPGLTRSLESTDLPSSVAGSRPGGGSSTIGSLPQGLGEGGTELDDRDIWPEFDRRMDVDAPAEWESGRADAILVRPGEDALLGVPSTSNRVAPYGTMVRPPGVPSLPDAMRSSNAQLFEGPPGVETEEGGAPLRLAKTTPTVPMRDAFPPGLREDDFTPRPPTGGGWADPDYGGAGPGRDETSGDGLGSRHGVSAEDLLKTNELLRQLIEETKRQRVASLPAASPMIYPGR